MGEKVYSSTASGYVILPKLKDSTYSLYLGQPGSQVKELRFTVSINNADHGFLLKNFQNEWGLFDLQSMAVINPTPSTSGVMYDSNSVKSDRFTRLLAKAVNDSTLLMEPVMAKAEPRETKKEEKEKKAAKDKDEAVAKASEDDSVKEDVAVNMPVTESAPVATSSAADSNAVKETTNKETSGNDSVVKAEAVAARQTITPKETVVPQETSAPADTVATIDTALSKDTFSVKETAVSDQAASDEATAPKDAVVQNDQKADTGEINAGTPEQTEFKRSVVKKYAESSNFQGFGLTFVDTWEGVTDTIRLVIPNIVDASSLVKTEQLKADNQAKTGNKVPDQVMRETLTSNDNKTLTPVVLNETSNSDVTKEKDSIQTTVTKEVVAPANCKDEASNSDFLELRKNMASKDRGEEMLDEARKAFKERCYTTEQIRKLSVLFYTQEGKFLFFKDAKPFVSDKDRFSTLLFEFHDNAYQERFKSLLEN
jgi:hypothetical protein